MKPRARRWRQFTQPADRPARPPVSPTMRARHSHGSAISVRRPATPLLVDRTKSHSRKTADRFQAVALDFRERAHRPSARRGDRSHQPVADAGRRWLDAGLDGLSARLPMVAHCPIRFLLESAGPQAHQHRRRSALAPCRAAAAPAVADAVSKRSRRRGASR